MEALEEALQGEALGEKLGRGHCEGGLRERERLRTRVTIERSGRLEARVYEGTLSYDHIMVIDTECII